MKPKIIYDNAKGCWICGAEFIDPQTRTIEWFWAKGLTIPQAYHQFMRLYGHLNY